MRVAVFGGNDARPGDAAYDDARELGRLLARAGHVVVTGGYGGVMEAASRGAREGDGPTHGVLCAAFDRAPNEWLTDSEVRADLWERTRALIESCGGYVVLPGKAGTLAELSFVWALRRAGCLGERPVVLLGDSWRGVMAALERAAMLYEAERPYTLPAGTPEEAVELLCRRRTNGNGTA